MNIVGEIFPKEKLKEEVLNAGKVIFFLKNI